MEFRNLKEINKAYTEGIYSDSPLNRKLGRVGMTYTAYAEKTKASKEKEAKKEENFEGKSVLLKNGKSGIIIKHDDKKALISLNPLGEEKEFKFEEIFDEKGEPLKKFSNKENSKASTSKLIDDKIKSALSSNKETVIEINKYYDLVVESKVKTKDSKDGYSRVAFLMKKDNNEENTAEEVPYSGVINLDSEESFIKEVKEKINKYVKKGTKK